MSETWRKLAEAVGLADATNWSNVNKRRNMAQYGSMDRRNQQGPMPYFKPPAVQQGVQQARAASSAGQGQAAMASIPFGMDAPTGRPNPLMTPSRPPSPLSRSANSPRGTTPPPMAGGEDEEDEGLY